MAARLHREQERIAHPDEGHLGVDLPVLRERLPGVQVERPQERRRPRAEDDQVGAHPLLDPAGGDLVGGVGGDRLDAGHLARERIEPRLVAGDEATTRAFLAGQRLDDAAGPGRRLPR